jgi:hypothetical protein
LLGDSLSALLLAEAATAAAATLVEINVVDAERASSRLSRGTTSAP